MARFLIVTWDGGGNVPPALGIAQALRERRHDVVFAGYASQQARFTAAGFRFVLLARSEAALREAPDEPWPKILHGRFVCTPQLEEIPSIFAQERADVVLVDCMLFAALAACEVHRLPTAVLHHSTPGMLLRADSRLGQNVPPTLNQMRASIGLAPIERLWETSRGMDGICTSIPHLDPLAPDTPEYVTYVGPVFEPAAPATWRSPHADDDRRPLVLVSFSTSPTSSHQRSRYERTLAALGGLPCRALVTTSGTDIDGVAVPDNAVVVRYAPHREILREAAVTVTHAGHGTLIASLAHGVPLVCLPNPIIADQLPLSQHVERLGAGRALDGDEATPDEISAAVHDVLTDPSYRARAQELAAAIAATDGASTAAARLELLAAG